MRFSKYSFLVLIISILIISGCQNNTKSIGQYLGGVEGIKIAFSPAAPTSSFNQGDNVPVKVVLTNFGESEVAIAKAQVKIFGIPHATFGISDQYKPTSGVLLPKSFDRNQGGEQTVDMGLAAYNLDVVNFEKFDFQANVCYDYYTKADINVCITSVDIQQSTATQGCTVASGNTVERIAKGDVSSAPVQITSLKEDLRGSNEVLFTLLLENKGNGKIYKIENQCSDLDKPESLDLVDMVKLDVPTTFSCALIDSNSNSGYIRLTGGKATVNCRRVVTEANSFTEKFKATLSYKYISTTSKTITIYSPSTASKSS